ncbi:hypothetical protein [Methanosarcina barkeri]|uniref:hypothetical protein n=1 Tax=Methanosarcina barkeri TaxID=2208 RepID=UPI001FB2B87D|nr:hypothetical protein [Methanosarcina barkeri]
MKKLVKKKRKKILSRLLLKILKPEKNQGSNILKHETSESKKAKRSTRERKANNKEQKLPKKYKKGW